MQIKTIKAGRSEYYAIFSFWTADKCVAVFSHRIDKETNEILYTDRLEEVTEPLAAARITANDVTYDEDGECYVKLETKGFAEAVECLNKQDAPDFSEELTTIDFACRLFDYTPKD